MESRVRDYIRQQNMICPGEKVLVGLSGGADSVCLLRILKGLSGELGFLLAAVHVNHGIRGDSAVRDEAFSEELARKLEIPFYAYHEDVPALADKWGVSLETAGRKVRYADLNDAADRFGAAKIAVAHHENDQAETVLFRMFRGTGVTGLAGMAPVSYPGYTSVPVIRPLLCVTKTEITQWLTNRGVDWVEDETNGQDEYSRNRIRMDILPEAEQICSGAVHNIARMAELAGETNEYLEQETEGYYRQMVEKEAAGSGLILNLAKYRRLHPFMRKLVFRKMVREQNAGRDFGEVHISQLIDLAAGETGKVLYLPGNMMARKEYDILILKVLSSGDDVGTDNRDDADKADHADQADRAGYVTDRSRIHMEISDIQQTSDANTDIIRQIPSKRYTKWFDYDKIKGNLTIRTKEEKDVMTIDSAGHKKPVRRIFIDEKIPASMRDRVLLLADEDEVIWIIGSRISETYKIKEDTTHILKVWIEGGINNE